MDARRFDSIAKLFSERRLSRRQAMITGGTALVATGIAAAGLARTAAAQDATPVADEEAGPRDPEMLFVQSFQGGAIAAVEGAEGRYTLTLESGPGQTIYFSDRPDRIVGAVPTPEFFDLLGFADENPPNAALVVETAPGVTDVAVVELFTPVYDEATRGLTYEIEVLANWEASLEMGFGAAPTDLATLEPSFGAAHLFIDGVLDCPDGEMSCVAGGNVVGTIPNADHDGFCQGWLFPPTCLPCEPWFGSSGLITYWNDQCNQRFAECQGQCEVTGWCTSGRDCPYVQ